MQVPTRIAAFWGLGAFATTTMLNGVSIVLLFFLVNFVKVEPVIAGGLLFASKLFDGLIDPPIGMLSDRTESRFGRRRPWMLGGSFFCGLSFALLFNVPMGASQTGVYLFVSGWLFVYTVAYAVFTVPYLAMPGELTDDYHDRSRLMSWRTVFMTFGNLMGAAVPPVMVSAFGGDRPAYGRMGIIIGLVIFAAMVLTVVGTAGARQRARDPEPMSLMENFRILRRNVPLLILMGTKILLYIGLAAFTAVLLFFFSSLLKKDSAAVGAYFGVFSLATILFTPVQLWVGRRFEKRSAYLVCMGAYSLGMLSWLLATPAEPNLVLYARGAVARRLQCGPVSLRLLDARRHLCLGSPVDGLEARGLPGRGDQLRREVLAGRRAADHRCAVVRHGLRQEPGAIGRSVGWRPAGDADRLHLDSRCHPAARDADAPLVPPGQAGPEDGRRSPCLMGLRLTHLPRP